MEISMLHRRDTLILTTIEVMDELGIQGLSTREIAKRQGISEATLFRHYRTKNELLLAVLDFYSQYDSDIVKSIHLKKLLGREAIFFWMNSYVEYYENYPAITSITQVYDVLANDESLFLKINEIFQYRNNSLAELIEQAKAAGHIKAELSTQSLVDTISGLKMFNCLKWRLNKFDFSLKQTTLSALTMILDSIKP